MSKNLKAIKQSVLKTKAHLATRVVENLSKSRVFHKQWLCKVTLKYVAEFQLAAFLLFYLFLHN